MGEHPRTDRRWVRAYSVEKNVRRFQVAMQNIPAVSVFDRARQRGDDSSRHAGDTGVARLLNQDARLGPSQSDEAM